MKQIIDEKDDTIRYVFEDHEKEIADEFLREQLKIAALEYVMEKALDGITSAFVKDVKSGNIVRDDTLPIDVDVIAIAIESISELIVETTEKKEDSWRRVFDLGLPNGYWTFDRNSRVFTLEKD